MRRTTCASNTKLSKPTVCYHRTAPAPTGAPAASYHRGDFDAALKQAPIQLDYTYVTPVETHNPMEMHGTIAAWEGNKLTLYESSQGVVNHHNVASQVLDMPLEDIDVISLFVGSGFGDKLFPWPHSWMTAVASEKTGTSGESRSSTQPDVHYSWTSSGNSAEMRWAPPKMEN